MQTPILGSAYTARSVNAADSRMVNLFPEMVPEAGKQPAFLQRCPGLTRRVTVGTGPIRGMWWHASYLYVVSGNTLYQVNSSWVAVPKGTVAGTGLVSMADNGTQIMIVADPTGYIYNTSTGVLTPTTRVGYSTITFTNVGDSVTLQYFTQGWAVIGVRGATVA